MKENKNLAGADGLLGDMKVTLDVPIGTSVSIVIAATLIFVAFYLTRRYLGR